MASMDNPTEEMWEVVQIPYADWANGVTSLNNLRCAVEPYNVTYTSRDAEDVAVLAPSWAPSWARNVPAMALAPVVDPLAPDVSTQLAPAPKRRLVAKNHDCEICAMRFPSASALARHVLTHTGVKPHACTWSECGKSFPSASALTQHVRVHTKEQPFACELPGCGKGFSQKINLKTHMDRHNGVTYRCDSCGKGGFTDTSNLSNHQTYRCGGEKKFPCEVCLVAFGSKFDLNRHKNTSKTHKEKVVEASKTHKRKAGEAFPSDA